MRLQSSLGRARGLGSAKHGVSHWWAQRLTAIALVPLAIWFVLSVIGLIGADYATFTAWVGSPGNAAMMILLFAAVFHHGQLGVQVVIEDYVHSEAIKTASLIAVKLVAILLATFSTIAVLKAGIGG